MIFTGISFRGNDYTPFEIQDKLCYFGKDKYQNIEFFIRLADDTPEYYVTGKNLVLNNPETTSVEGSSLKLSSSSFSVSGSTLTIA